jgi:CubicO group peptidase (beta-lactamase class C family)
MTDTTFYVAADDTRLAALYRPGPGGTTARLDALGQGARQQPEMLSGGGGLISTAADYHRFTQMVLGRVDSPAGELDGARLLSPRTVAYMARNHLPGGLDLETFGRPLYAEEDEKMAITFTPSDFPPLALGFFGLGTGYLIYGPQELVHWPPRDESVDRTTGVWGIWMPGFCQLVAGIILFIGLDLAAGVHQRAAAVHDRPGFLGVRHPLVRARLGPVPGQ